MIDIVREIEAVHREVGEGRIPAGVGRSVRLRRDYDAPIEDVWDAVDESRTDRALVPADQRGLSPRRSATSSRATQAARSWPANGRTGSR